MQKLALFLVVAVSMTLASCGGDNGPVIEVISPVSGNSFKQNTDVVFDFRLSDEEGLASIAITNALLGVNVTETFESNTLVNYTFTLGLGDAPTDKYDIVITVIDTDGNSEEEKVEIEVIE